MQDKYWRTFLREIVPMINPKFVVNTGDSCDSKDNYEPSISNYFMI